MVQRRRLPLRAAAATLVAVVLGLAVPLGAAAQDPPWSANPAVDQRAQAILSQMTLEEKIDLVTGVINPNNPFFNNGNERLGVPPLGAQDGPVGVRLGGGSSGNPAPHNGKATLLPSGTALASTFDTDRAFQYGRVLGVEAFRSRSNMMLAPTTDVLRNPFNPRAWETFSEDPLLTGELGAADTAGIQSVPGVGASVKHYALNTQEHRRQTVNAVVDERTLEELYVRPFETVVGKAHPASVMCAFTSVNGVDACSSTDLLTSILKGRLGFKGFVMTDYQANLETVESANAGLDLDMPGVNPGENGATAISGSTVWAGKLLQAVQSRQVSEAKMDDKVLRILRAMIGVGMFEHPPTLEDLPVQEHGQFAREASAAGTVLLKNRHRTLPLTNRRLRSIAVIGPQTDIAWRGAGSAVVNPAYEVSPLDAIRERAGDDVEILTAEGVEPIGGSTVFAATPPVPRSFLAPPGGQPGEGLRGEYFASTDLSGAPVATITDPIAARAQGFYLFLPAPTPGLPVAPQAGSIRWTGTLTAPTTGNYRFNLTAFGTARAFLDGELLAEMGPSQHVGHPDERTFDLRLRAGERHDIRIEYLANSPEHTSQFGFLFGAQVSFGWVHGPNQVAPRIREAAATAGRADAAIVFARTFESEGFIDRATLELPNDQAQLIREVARRNPRTTVVLQTGGAVATRSWATAPEATLENWFGGEEQGHAIADVLWGDVNPSGSLPITLPRRDRETPITFRDDPVQYPEVNDRTEYKEGIFVGYRGHQEFRLPVGYPFGHGLSYTAFRYSRLSAPRTTVTPGTGDIRVRFTITNTGRRPGTEIAQVYTGRLPTAIETSPRTLAGWARVTLDPGESRRVTVTLDPRAFQYWDVDADRWLAPSGVVRVRVGASVKNIRLRGAVRVGS
jgi:beta-glucosidase